MIELQSEFVIHSDNTQARLIEAAIILFASRGFEATSIRQVAETVGIKGPAIYNHFSSKEDLLLSSMSVILADFHSNVVAPDDRRSPPDERLKAMVERHVRYQIDNPVTTIANDRLLDSGILDRIKIKKRALNSLLQPMKNYQDLMAEIVELSIGAGRIEKSRAKLIAITIGTMCSHIWKWYRPDGVFEADAIVENFVRAANGIIVANQAAVAG